MTSPELPDLPRTRSTAPRGRTGIRWPLGPLPVHHPLLPPTPIPLLSVSIPVLRTWDATVRGTASALWEIRTHRQAAGLLKQ